MLYFALIMSCLLLIAGNIAARTRRKPVFLVAVLGLVAGAMLVDSPPTMLFALLLCMVGPWWKATGGSRRSYAALSCAAAVVVFTIPTIGAISEQMEYAKLRERFPYESMDERLPTAPEGNVAHDDARLHGIESTFPEPNGSARSFFLKRLHEDKVQLFVTSPGFGAMRIIRPREKSFTRELRFDPSPLQPTSQGYGIRSEPSVGAARDLDEMHANGVSDFVHPDGFGYVKDRQHVAGFQSHRFSKVPESGAWTIERLELVSLLMHKEPGVYVSDRLPQMDALKGVPLRPLDEFEQEGLKALREGQDLHLRDQRMLGSIRSTKQCIACHGGERGQLLGAFTYSLRPSAK